MHLGSHSQGPEHCCLEPMESNPASCSLRSSPAVLAEAKGILVPLPQSSARCGDGGGQALLPGCGALVSKEAAETCLCLSTVTSGIGSQRCCPCHDVPQTWFIHRCAVFSSKPANLLYPWPQATSTLSERVLSQDESQRCCALPLQPTLVCTTQLCCCRLRGTIGQLSTPRPGPALSAAASS